MGYSLRGLTIREATQADIREIDEPASISHLKIGSAVEQIDDALEVFRGSAKLEKVEIFGGIGDDGVALLSSIHTLQDLNISFCNTVQSRSVAMLAEHPRLRSLVLDACYDVTDEAFMKPSGFQQLALLSLQSLENLSDISVAAISQFPNLRTLILPEFSRITDDGMIRLANSGTGIQELSISSLEISNKSVEALARGPRLSLFSIDGCRGVTDEALRAFRRAQPGCRLCVG